MTQVRTFAASNVALIRAPRELASLANMSKGYDLRIGGVSLPTSEHLYQASKLPCHLRLPVIAAKNGWEAKDHAYRRREDWHPQWFEIRISVMQWCLTVKLVQHWDRLSVCLAETAGKHIVEWSRTDQFWGATTEYASGPLTGQNHLGNLWTQLRDLVLGDRRVELKELLKPPHQLRNAWAWPVKPGGGGCFDAELTQ